jgi:hypothetical protein
VRGLSTIVVDLPFFYLGVEGAAGTASVGEEIDDDEPVAGVEQGVGEVLRGLDLPHVGLDPLLPRLHGLANHQVHLWTPGRDILKA